MTTFALVALTLMATLFAAAATGRWWLRRLVMAPVQPAVSIGGSPCDGCTGSQALLMAAADGGQAGASGPSGSSGGAAKKKKSGPDRRTFLRGALGLSAFGALGGFGAASIAFLWPNIRGGFGAVFEVASEAEVLAEIDAGEGRMAFRPARALLVRYDPADDPDGQYADLTNNSQVMALYQTCVHLGCTVPWCETSHWWECPCHGSQYNRWGEWQDGPAPRGLDRFRTSVGDDGVLFVDTSEIVTGPARQQRALDQPPEGPHCV